MPEPSPQAVSAPAVDVAATRAALAKATPGPWRVLWSDLLSQSANVEPIVLRNNAEALLDASGCPTMCDTDCAAVCHEVHQASFKREHSPEDCRATQFAEAERRGAVKALENLHDRIKPGMSLAVQIDAYIYAIQNGEVSP